jgi:phenylalanine-4-hydroxylase
MGAVLVHPTVGAMAQPAPSPQDPPGEGRLSLLLELEDAPGALGDILAPFADAGVNMTHIESRPAKDGRFDFFVDCEGTRGAPAIEALLEILRARTFKLLVLDEREVPWFPRRVDELDRVANHTLDAGTDLQSDHPGFSDTAYRERRARIDALARAHRHGEPIPTVDYAPEEVETWRAVWRELRPLHERHGCEAFRRAIAAMETECGYGPEAIPQARDVSAFLESRTGFRLRPVAGLLSGRDFLAGLAFRTFFSTQYIRHHSHPLYTPEPDVCHELIGHAPMFADPAFAELSQEIGLASLGASDAEIERLARCYWFSVEFGLVREDGALKAYGAGLLSSYGELAWACDETAAERPALKPWVPAEAAEQDYPITEYQPLYFIADSLQDAKERMRRHCEALPRPFHARWNPTTESIWVDRAIRRGD